MKTDIPKQFIEVEGIPILMRTILKFYEFDNQIKIVVVLPESQIPYWDELIKQHNFEIEHLVVHGGKTRFHSVKNGLDVVNPDYLIGIHDGVRPFVSGETLKRSFESAKFVGNAIPALPVKESIRWVEDEKNKPMDREKIWSVQTPQVFHGKLIKKAFEQGYQNSFTDDASVLEASGHSINIVKGNPENIKITEKIDLIFASALIKNSTEIINL
jgi:2-C-methyl-D-erythritol 4-phosphate cytidylyltransferase